jgi:hypothetical protein
LAPKLLRLELLPGGWLVVTLQYLALKDGWVGLNALLEFGLRGGSTLQAGVGQGQGQQLQQRAAQPPRSPAAGSSQRPGPATAMSVAEVQAQCQALTPKEWAELFAHIEGQVQHAHAVRMPLDNGGAGADAGAPVHSAQAPAPHAAGSSAVPAAVPAAADAISSGGCGVHGDMRPPNILLQLEPGGSLASTAPKVMVVDFDWAGVEGTARYPPFISNQVRVHARCACCHCRHVCMTYTCLLCNHGSVC